MKTNIILNEQIQTLVQKGVFIENIDDAKYILSMLNYHTFIGYIPEFLDENTNYKNNISFNDIYKIYLFDRRLRNLILYILEIIENTLKTKFAIILKEELGDFGYLDLKNYKEEKEYKMLINNIKVLISKDKKIDIINKYNKIFGKNLPIDICINIFTMGMLNTLYKNINTQIQKKIAKEYKTGVNQLTNWLENIVYVRNLVAHYMRIYNFKLQKTPATCKINFETDTVTYRIFDIIYIMKFLVLDYEEWNNYILISLETLLDEYENFIELNLIGFSSDWKNLLLKKIY